MDAQKKRKGFKRSYTASSSSSTTVRTNIVNNNQPTEAEISLAKRLVHTDKEIRDAALTAVGSWLTNQVQGYNHHHPQDNNSTNTVDNGLNELPDNTDPLTIEMMKMWKALYYCVWMSDKPAIQNELVTNLANLIQTLPNHTYGGQLYSILYIKGCLDTLYREWLGLDRYRVDKYLLLIRRLINSSFTFIGKIYKHHQSNPSKSNRNPNSSSHNGSISTVTILTILYTQYFFQPPNGIRLHLVDIYLEEIITALPTISDELFQLLMVPVYKSLESMDDKVVFQRIIESIFNEKLFSSTSTTSTTLTSSNTTTSTDDDGTTVVYNPPLPNINYAILAQQLFRIGANPQTRGGYRDAVYGLHKVCVKVAKALGHVEKTTDVYGTSKKTISNKHNNDNNSSRMEAVTTTLSSSSSFSSKGGKHKDKPNNNASSSSSPVKTESISENKKRSLPTSSANAVGNNKKRK